jgi:SAM-dependent methyltransferase
MTITSQFTRLPLRAIRSIIYRVPPLRWLNRWTFPLYLARMLLENSVKQSVHYAGKEILDVGCGIKPYRALFADAERYIGIDLPNSGKIDVAGSALLLPFKAASFDTVLCNEVLEHVPEPSTLMLEVARVLRPGGTLILTTPQTWGLHLEPYDFYRYTKYGLTYLATKNGLEVIEISPTCGMWATWSQRFADTVIYTYGVKFPRWLKTLISIGLAPVLLAGYGLDRLFGKRGDTLDNLLIARKPAH